MRMPLEDVRVLDLSHALAGPFCSTMLADFGADVIKLEPRGAGDIARAWGSPLPGGETAYFVSLHRNKKGIEIDLKAPEGKDLFFSLVAKCDVVLENYRVGALARLGLGYEAARERNAGIIYCSVSGFGQDGPYRDRAARTSPSGELILLNDQDRLLWNRDQISEGMAVVERALVARDIGPYSIQAAIAAVHASALNAAATDWAQIVALYDLLTRAEPSPVIELNRAVAVAMRDGPTAGLALIDAILGRGALADYHLAHSARAELCRRLGRAADARASYTRALDLARQEPQRRFLERRLRELLD